MALLTEEQRDELRGRFEAAQSGVWAEIAVTRPEIRAAVDALDTYFHGKAAEINNTLPEPARSGLTTVQKSWIVRSLVAVKYGD